MSQFERLHQISDEASLNNYFELCYGLDLSQKLKPLQEIEDKDLVVELIDNNNINPKRLLILGKDYQPITVHVPETGDIIKFNQPGKSGRLCLGNYEYNQSHLNQFLSTEFNVDPNRRHHMHVAQISDINNIGYAVYWAPLQIECLPMHVRIVFQKTIRQGILPNLDDAEKLASVFLRKI